MVDSGVGRVAVVDPDDRTVIGIISRQDLLKVRSTQMSGEIVKRVRRKNQRGPGASS
jgi:predicted transcriptional regulator